jgi:hypothetical protein
MAPDIGPTTSATPGQVTGFERRGEINPEAEALTTRIGAFLGILRSRWANSLMTGCRGGTGRPGLRQLRS